MSVRATSSAAASSLSAASNLPPIDIASEIKKMNAEQIQEIAKAVIDTLMDHDIKIDPPTENKEEESVDSYALDLSAHRETPRRTRFMNAILPLMVREITKAFSNPPQSLLEEGSLPLLLMGKGGMIEEMQRQHPDYEMDLGIYGENCLARYEQKNRVDIAVPLGSGEFPPYATFLTVDYDQLKKTGKLSFCLGSSTILQPWQLTPKGPYHPSHPSWER